VSKRSVTARASREGWQERLASVEAEARTETRKTLATELSGMNDRHVRMLHAIEHKALQALQAAPIGTAAQAAAALIAAVRAERAILAPDERERSPAATHAERLEGAAAFSPAAVEAALAVGASIYAVDMSSLEVSGTAGRQSAFSLKGFAEKTGGRFISTPGGPALRDAFTGIADELGHQYTISYHPLNKTRDGKWRKLEVKVKREDVEVRTRKGYRGPK